jgi:hypothetical protein
VIGFAVFLGSVNTKDQDDARALGAVFTFFQMLATIFLLIGLLVFRKYHVIKRNNGRIEKEEWDREHPPSTAKNNNAGIYYQD